MSFFAPGWTEGMMAIQLSVRFSPVRRLPQVLKEKTDYFLKEAFLFHSLRPPQKGEEETASGLNGLWRGSAIKDLGSGGSSQ